MYTHTNTHTTCTHTIHIHAPHTHTHTYVRMRVRAQLQIHTYCEDLNFKLSVTSLTTSQLRENVIALLKSDISVIVHGVCLLVKSTLTNTYLDVTKVIQNNTRTELNKMYSDKTLTLCRHYIKIEQSQLACVILIL